MERRTKERKPRTKKGNALRLLTRLRRQHPPDLAAAALELARLRIKARSKFGDAAARMVFTRDALEQATDLRISRYRFRAWPGGADLCCGIGGDTFALAETGRAVGCDLDPLRLSMARLNVPDAHFIRCDATRPLPFNAREISRVFFDPGRRAAGKRIFKVRDYQPPLATVRGWTQGVVVKASPGVDLSEVAEFGFDQIEFISLEGDLKECDLHRSGGEYSPQPAHIATLIDRAGTIRQMHRAFDAAEPQIGVSAPGEFLYEPDPAVIRAGLVQDFGAQIGAALLDPTIAYLTSAHAKETPFARRWQAEAWMPFNLKKLREALRERGVGRVTVKKRGSPLTPEELITKLRLPGGGEERIIVLTRAAGQPVIGICLPPTAAL